MSLLLLCSVRSMQEMVGLRAGGRGGSGGGGTGTRHGLVVVLLMYMCVVGSCCGALGGASCSGVSRHGLGGCGGYGARMALLLLR